MSLIETLAKLRRTNVTKTTHREPYAAISPTRPGLSQAGKVILITGGGTGAGFAMAQAFIRASASTIIITSRRGNVLDAARSRLEQEANLVGGGTKIVAITCDVVNQTEVDALWKELDEQGIAVDVYIANAAKFTEVKPILELGAEEVWSQVETNMKSPLYFTERFYKQASGKQKFILNISTASIHSTTEPEVKIRPAYTLSKLSGTLLFQLLAQDHPHEEMQIISFHPGLIYNDYWKSLDLKPEDFDSEELTGAFAVWAASKEAAFLHGRFVWCSWDVEELATGEIRKRLDEDFYYLRTSIVGLRGGFVA
ncbi:NAD(P)-binding protein [Dothidotthia symphoricarpi CBS 119687]|uniref:NAD(P)-binding protein n=1 Tax=Dothidotthia symphoricarpi CBS 119687 TaxID=1392245 RepID=A0A6A6A3M7_9PLEO|nr:NAD(P)-binding protein [Dothidotthia symphoricarpi CBS 119687]KAF2126489.1 NAD(P)-binding protein [Dothidotthia symphoricarpi CBS 119687]